MRATPENVATDVEPIAEFLRVFTYGRTHELRILGDGGVTSKTFCDATEAAAMAADASGLADVYVTLNPTTKIGDATGDADVSRVVHFSIDFDAARLHSKSPATPEEVEACWAEVQEAREYLRARGWPEPVVVDSGNGFWLHYAVDMANDDASREWRRLAILALNERFPMVDRTSFNAARIARVAGTINRKGGRLASVASMPERVETASTGLVQDLAYLARDTLRRESTPTTAGEIDAVTAALEARGVEIIKTKSATNALYLHELEPCPFDPAHVNGSAFLLEWEDGGVTFRCHHNGCADHRTGDLRRLLGLPAVSVEGEEEEDDGLRFLALNETIPETVYLDDPIVPAGAFVFFVGAEASSKTALARWLALRVASQEHRVLYFSEDNPELKDRQFLARFLAGMGLPSTELPAAMRFAQSQGVDLSELYWRERVMKQITRWQPELIVIDGYTTVFGGGMAAQDYENWDTASVYSRLLKQVRPICNSAVITICHGPNLRATMLPGGSGLKGVADLTVAFEGEYTGGSASYFECYSTKATRYRGFRFEGIVRGPDDDRSPLVVELSRRDESWRDFDSSVARGTSPGRSSSPLARAPR